MLGPESHFLTRRKGIWSAVGTSLALKSWATSRILLSFSYRWDPNEALGEDVRFKNYGLAPKSAADFAFLLHGFHYLKDDGVMAIILPHGVLFRGAAEAMILKDRSGTVNKINYLDLPYSKLRCVENG